MMALKVAPFVLDRPKQIGAIRDLVYEYGNLMAAGYYDVHGQAPWRTNCDDAFLLGCRKLGDFLLNDTRKFDDVLARDYLPPGTVRTWDLPTWNATWSETMNKYLAHIAYARVDNRPAKGLPEWDHLIWVPKLIKEFNNAWWDFREAVTDREFATNFDEEVRCCQTKVGFDKIVLQRH